MKYLITYKDKSYDERGKEINFGLRTKGGIDLLTFDFTENDVFMQFRSGHKIQIQLENVVYLEIEDKKYIEILGGEK